MTVFYEKATGVKFYIDDFSSNFAEKDHGNRHLVLAHIEAGGRFSTFDATDTLMATLDALVAEGKIVDVRSGYPWHTYRAVKPKA